VFDITSTLIVWMCLFLQVEFVLLRAALPPDRCGQLEMSFLLVLSVLLSGLALLLLHDLVLVRWARLSRPMKWLRTLPAATGVLVAAGWVAFRTIGWAP
jgi:hypothetical protein